MSFKVEDRLQSAIFVGTPASANSFLTAQIITNLSAELKRVWAIWGLELFYPFDASDAIAEDKEQTVVLQLTHNVQSGQLGDGNGDIILAKEARLVRQPAIGTAAGPMWYFVKSPLATWLPKPIAFAGAALNVGLRTANMVVANEVTAKIWYTVITVSSQEFLEISRCR